MLKRVFIPYTKWWLNINIFLKETVDYQKRDIKGFAKTWKKSVAIYCKASVFVQKRHLWFVYAPLETCQTELGQHSNVCSNNISNLKIIQFTAVFFFLSPVSTLQPNFPAGGSH